PSKTGKFACIAEKAARPERIIRVALLKFHPNTGSDDRNGDHAKLKSPARETGLGPARRAELCHIGYLDEESPALHRIDIVQDHAAVLAIEPAARAGLLLNCAFFVGPVGIFKGVGIVGHCLVGVEMTPGWKKRVACW